MQVAPMVMAVEDLAGWWNGNLQAKRIRIGYQGTLLEMLTLITFGGRLSVLKYPLPS